MGGEQVSFHLWRETWDPEPIAWFTIDGEPMSKARPRLGKNTNVYNPAAVKKAQEVIGWTFRAAAPRYQVQADWRFGLACKFFHATRQRRDVDNMLKLVMDGLTKLVWDDDSQVVEVSAAKQFVVQKDWARTEVVVYQVNMHEEKYRATCKGCGQDFEIDYACWGKTRAYCSTACRGKTQGAAYKAARMRTCEVCGITFEMGKNNAGRFCSRACSNSRSFARYKRRAGNGRSVISDAGGSKETV